VRNDVAAKTTNSTTAVSTGTWHLLEAHLVVAGSSSKISVSLDGTPVSGLSLTDDFGTTPVQRIQFGDNSGGKTFDLYFDDITVDVPSAATRPVNTTPPSISGNATDQSTLTADTGAWTGSAPMTPTYQWRDCDSAGFTCIDIAGATGSTYTLRASDIGQTIQVVVTQTNAAGSASATSGATAMVAGTAPANTAVPSISGTPDGTSTLSANSGRWSGSTPIDYAYQWQSCAPDGSDCADISDATSAQYRPTASDGGRVLRVQVTASNVAGSAQASSDVTAPVGAGGPVNTAAPSISGTMLEGQALTADTGTWTGAAPIDYSYQWRHCNSDGSGCTNVAGATSSTYILSTYDSGATLDVLVTATDSAGSTFARSATVALRMPLFAEGFESGTLANWTNFGLTTQQANVFAGSWAARSVSTAGTASYATAVLPAAQGDITYRLRFKGNTAWPSTGVYLMKLRTGTNSSIVGISVSGSGRLAYRNDVAAAGTTTTATVSSGVWHEVVVHVTIAGASGSIDMTLDGTHVSGLPKTENLGTAPVAKIQVGENSTGRNYDVAADEIVVGSGN
jgi:hypothetical protein